MDCMSTSRPRSLKMPFSNAYHMTQSSALTLLYAATTFLQQAIGESFGAPEAVAAWDAATLGAVEVVGVPPPHAMARIPMTDTRTASLSRMSPSRLRSDLWSPALESVLDTLQRPREEDAGARDEDDRRELLRRLERHAVVLDELADAVTRGDELGHDESGECVTHTQAQTGEDERHRAREHDALEDEHLRRAERARDAQERGVGVPDAGHGVDDLKKSAPRKMTATFDCQSIPNQMMNSGMSTMRGVA